MIAVVVATRNEAATIGPLVTQLREHTGWVIVADESDLGDDTPHQASYHGARVVTGLNGRQGLGPSLIRGWLEALRFHAERVVQIDAGGSHDPDDIPTLLGSAADVVIGSRFLPASEYVGRPWRARASRIYGYSMYARSGLPVYDWTSGFRAFTGDALRDLVDIPYAAKMHGFQAEVLLNAHHLGLSVEEVPIRYQAGDSALRIPHMWEAIKVR